MGPSRSMPGAGVQRLWAGLTSLGGRRQGWTVSSAQPGLTRGRGSGGGGWGSSPRISPRESGELEHRRPSMRGGSRWKGLPYVVGAWLLEFPPLSIPRGLAWKKERAGGVQSL